MPVDAERTGRFIAALRREKGLTQRALAEQLSVTDKAVSRWETGKGLPDAALLAPLAAALGVSVGELLAGARETPGEEKTSRPLRALRYAAKALAGAAGPLLAVSGAVLLLSPLVTVGPSSLFSLGLVLLAGAVALCLWRKGGARMKRERFLYAAGMVFLALAFLLELLPVGAVLIFAPAPGETLRVTVSHFDLTAFGYANFAPLPAGLLTVFCLVGGILALCFFRRAKRWRNALFVCTLAAALLSAAPLLLGPAYMAAGSWAVTLSLAVAAALQAAANGRS